jgi:hypothetical protein
MLLHLLSNTASMLSNTKRCKGQRRLHHVVLLVIQVYETLTILTDFVYVGHKKSTAHDMCGHRNRYKLAQPAVSLGDMCKFKMQLP